MKTIYNGTVIRSQAPRSTTPEAQESFIKTFTTLLSLAVLATSLYILVGV